ncbi:toll/interleukin-1 receptor domain-containing protein [Chryseobacterium sp. RG1]|uniref:Toll/interleukin-1 receptor domain-containing protein n=1 Tax=Chryseobacterium tagetis TaxID=2801334 RepID=A0ABS7ZXP9_9FLAO|nr:toll/interleukin-1 receptor domain-containing protein [Chryseobacterium tagetis]MCA6066509.1 toll/interleukin-1 receptor domain-containing protein [Chryseobacterium tagetis]
MINQENLYQLLYKENWKEILDILYEEKENIKNDTLLTFASKTFENEFLKKVQEYEIDKIEIPDYLQTMYILHHGKFYTLSDENYKQLIVEIVKRKSVQEAYLYAIKFPEEEICKDIISKYEHEKIKEEGLKLKKVEKLPVNWIEIYNRLFEIINHPEDTATYFSGPRFIDTVRKFEPYFPTYPQFIEQRNNEGKSTSRKIFYYDILLGLNENSRNNIIKRILEILKPFEANKVQQIENIIGGEIVTIPSSLEQKKENKNPTIFISYSWDNEEHKKWVLDLSDKLCTDGINVILDRYYLTPGKNLPHFVENNLNKANRIIIIFTPNYKLKADKRTGGVGYEYSIMNVDLYANQTSNEKIIPLLRSGSTEDSIPTFMRQFIHIDARNDENFLNSYNDLVREIYNEPEIKKPELGTKPIF